MPISFLTPYLSGLKWLELHISSIKKFHPDSEIIISAVNDEGANIAKKHGALYLNERLEFIPAAESLFSKAKNDVIVFSNHDTVLFSNINYLAEKLNDFDLIGIEERIKWPDREGWFRYAPGYMDLTLMMFSRTNAKSKMPTWPKFSPSNPKAQNRNHELHYGLCEALPKHYYLKPFGVKKYGIGNLIRDGSENILWHQWFGSWKKRGGFMDKSKPEANPYKTLKEQSRAEQRFFDDYPKLDLDKAKPLV